MQLMEVQKWPCIFIGIISQEHFRNKELEFLKENAPSIIAGGERYEICINQIITHITAGIRI